MNMYELVEKKQVSYLKFFKGEKYSYKQYR